MMNTLLWYFLLINSFVYIVTPGPLITYFFICANVFPAHHSRVQLSYLSTLDCPIQAWYQFLPELPYKKNWWFSWSCFTGQRSGSWHCALGEFGKDPTIGWTVSWWRGNPGKYMTDYGSIPRWRVCWKRRDCMTWISRSPASIKKLHSLLLPVTLWTYILRQRGGRGEGWSSGGGSRMDWIWRGCGRRIRRRKVQRGRGRWTGQWIWIWIESVIG